MGLEKLIIWRDHLEHFLHLDRARCRHSGEMEKEYTVQDYDGVAIEGSEDFIQRTVQALERIQRGAPEEYNVIQENIGKIKLNEYSGMVAYDSPPTFLVGATAFGNNRWYSCAIAHDAYHSKLYHDYLKQNPREYSVPNDVWTGRQVEIECNRFADLINKKMKGNFITKLLNKQDTLITRIVPYENVPLAQRCW
jgi:hypothetical protein|tara:strand:+ start:59 stop:640 length:582 start_codon:yes stop_codon:yes gene_type:complete